MTYLSAFPLIQSTDWKFEEQARDNLEGIEDVDVRHEVAM